MEFRAGLVWLLCSQCLVRAEQAQDTSLPRELLDMLAHADIRSIGDLQRLLEIDSVERPGSMPASVRARGVEPGAAGNRTRAARSVRSLAEEATAAVCRVRPVSLEIPRSQIDSTSANFLVWPPCVELPRCSGCCNTHSVRCQPSRTRHKYVKVAKIEYVKRRTLLKEALVKLEEHLDCTCGCLAGHGDCRDSDGPNESQHCQDGLCGKAPEPGSSRTWHELRLGR
ncbi:unnamed protein product [Lampetra planeri]